MYPAGFQENLKQSLRQRVLARQAQHQPQLSMFASVETGVAQTRAISKDFECSIEPLAPGSRVSAEMPQIPGHVRLSQRRWSSQVSSLTAQLATGQTVGPPIAPSIVPMLSQCPLGGPMVGTAPQECPNVGASGFARASSVSQHGGSRTAYASRIAPPTPGSTNKLSVQVSPLRARPNLHLKTHKEEEKRILCAQHAMLAAGQVRRTFSTLPS